MSKCEDCGEPAKLIDCDGCELCEDCALEKGWGICSECKDWVLLTSREGPMGPSDYCDDCFDHLFMACEACKGYYCLDDLCFCNDRYLCDDCAERHGWGFCRICGRWDVYTEREAPTNYEDYCEHCFDELFTMCYGCEEYFDNTDMTHTARGSYCEGCRLADDFRPGCFHNTSGYTVTGSARCYGLELETDYCDNYNDLAGHVAWGAKDDPTCSGKEFYSAILSGDDGLEAIADIIEFADNNDWGCSSDCGYHLHIDMRTEKRDSLFAIAYAYAATQVFWGKFTSSGRRRNRFCHTLEWTCADLTGFDGSFTQFVNECCDSRYNWLNLQAYHDHKTFEVRLHHATLDEIEICNWVKAHTRFADWASRIGLDEVVDKLTGKSATEQFDIIACEAWKDEKLSAYYAAKGNFLVPTA